MTRITIKQIAEEAGVSMTTVSNVLNKKTHRVSEETIQLVEEIIKKYNYIPNMNARSLVNSSSRLIGLLYYSKQGEFAFSDPFTSELLAGIEKESKKNGYFVLVHNVTSINELLTLQQNWNFEGFIIVGVSASHFSNVNQAIKKPTIYIDTYLFKEDYEKVQEQDDRLFINTNDYGAGILAMEHFVTCGHKDIAFLSYEFEKELPGVIEKRFQAYKNILGKYQYPLSKANIFVEEDFEKIDQSLNNFSAILVTSDYLAIKLIKFLKLKGNYSVERTSIIGFDDVYFSEYVDPGLTTIRLNPSQKGRIAFEGLMNICQNQPIAEQFKLLKGELILRESVANKKKS
ncbi:MAG: LacI family DNA-binding transcriptional regulator [Enterococcus lemanii]|jgi:LacI family transcriptional regulator